MVFVLGTIIACPRVEAATTTDVFRAVSDVISEVVLLHDANFTEASGGLVRSDGRKPRHVMQLARTVLRKANLLASINGGATEPLPWLPTWEITPTDLMYVVEPTAKVIRGLKPIFGVDIEIRPAAKNESRDADDVYSALYLLSQMIDGLGIPRSVPNDSYRIADNIARQLSTIAGHFDVPVGPPIEDDPGRTTRDVHRQVLALGEAIDRLIAIRPKLNPTGGVAKPQERSGTIDHEHVIHALNDLLAEVVAMRSATGDRKEIEPAPSVSGMNPSDVHDRLSDALAIVDDLSARS